MTRHLNIYIYIFFTGFKDFIVISTNIKNMMWNEICYSGPRACPIRKHTKYNTYKGNININMD